MAADQAGTQLQWNSQHGLMATVEANSKSFDKQNVRAMEYGQVNIKDNFQGNNVAYTNQGTGGAARAADNYAKLKQNIPTNDQNFNIYPQDNAANAEGAKRNDSLEW